MSEIRVDTISEKTSANGVAIDSVTLKDGTVDVNGASDGIILDADADTTISADTDDQIDFKAGGTDTMHIINGKVGIGTTSPSTNLHIYSTADNAPHLLLENFQNADTDDAPVIELYLNDQTTGGIGDDTDVGVIRFTGDEKDGGTKETYAEIRGVAHDPGQGTGNRGHLSFFVQSAGSLAETMTLDENKVGIGTNAPARTVQIVDSSATPYLSIVGPNDAGAGIMFGDTDDETVGRVTYDNSVNNLQFWTNDAERMRIDNAGLVGIGAASANTMLAVQTPASYNQYVVRFKNASTSAPYGILTEYSGSAPDAGSDYEFFIAMDTSATRCTIFSDGDIKNHDNSYGSLSDERIKQDIRDSNSQWDDIKAVKVRNFKKKDDVRQYGDNAWEQIGVIAQELETVSPKLIRKHNPTSFDILSNAEFGTLYEDGDTIPEGKEIGDVKEIKEQVKSVSYSILYMKAIKALQEAQTRIETLETKVAALEG